MPRWASPSDQDECHVPDSDPLPFNPFQYETVADCWREVYHRFSVDGLGVVGLGDAKKIGVLQTQTLAYLRQKRTVGQLESCVDALVHKERAIPRRLRPTSIPELTKMEHDCLRALYSAGGSYDTQRVAVERAVPGTCEWFLGHPDFVDWVSSDAAGVLWVTANAGCGKSVMSGFLADALASTARNLTVCSFFFKGGQDHRHEAYNGLCALLHQGILADPSAASLAATQFSSKEPGAFSEALEQLWSVFCRLAEQSPRPVVCILDALDECSAASRDRLIGLLAASFGGPDSKTPAPKNLKFLVTSRPYPEIEERFHSLRAIRLRGEDEAAAVSRDVESVVRHKVDEMRRRSALSPEGCALVEATLLRRAGATFLWVALVLDLLARLPSRKLRAVRALLEQIPDDLEQLYEHGLAETPRPDDTRRLLQILLVGSRPLRVEEVNIALNIREGTATLRELDDELEPNAEYTIGLLGRFFVKISQGLVFLVHETAREFLLRDAGHPVTTNGSWKHSIGLTESNSLLMRASITYLLLRDWPRRQTRPTKFEEQRRSNSVFLGELGNNYRDFYAYSAENWPLHAERGGEVAGNGPPNQQIQTLCDPESRTFKAWWYFYADYQFYEDIGGRIAGCSGTHHPHFAALRGDWAVLQGFLARGLSLSAKNTKGFDVLAVAVASKRWQVAGRLLDLSDPKQMQLETAMMCAIYYQHTGLVQRFIDLGVSVNQRHTHPLADLRPVEMLPLDAALNRPSVLPMLLDAGAEIKDTQLVECATMGWVKDLEVLFEADRARRSEENRLPGFQKALEAATSGARLKARRLILQQSDRIEDKYDLAPGFSAAAWRGDVDAVSELLTMGARDDGSALREAAQYAGTEITELLLDAMDYPQAALDKALAEFFDQVNAGIDRHLLTLLKKKDGDSGETVRPHKAVERTLAISESNEVTCGYLSLLLDKGARLPATVVHDVILRLIPMDEDFCVFVLENLGSLQKGDTLLSATAYLSVACFWARERVVRLILDGGASVGGPDAVGVTPLVAAVASGDVGMVRLLLAKGALDGTDQDGGPSGSPAAGGRGSSSCEPLEAPWSVWEAFWQAAGVDDTNSTAMDAARSKGYKDIEMELTGWLSVHGA